MARQEFLDKNGLAKFWKLTKLDRIGESSGGTLTWDGKNVSLEGHTHSYLPLTGGTLTGTLTLPNINISGTSSVLPSHYYHNLYSSTDYSVYEHFGQSSDRDKVTYGQFRFFDGNGGYKTLLIGGDGTFKWNGTNVSLNGHTHSFASITSKPTTLSGYGITDAALASDLGKYLPLTGGTLSGNLACNGSYIYMKGTSGAKGYMGYFNQSGAADRASGSHIFMSGGGYALGSNSVSIGYQAYAGIRNKDSDSETYPYIHWQWFPTEKFTVNTTNSSLGGGDFYGYPLLPNETVEWEIGGRKITYQNTSAYKEVLVVIKDSDADTGLKFGGKTSLPYRTSKTLIAGKYIVGSGEYLKKIDEYTINGVKYYQVIIYTWNTTAFPTSYDFTQQVKVMCATKVSGSNYVGTSSYASGAYSVASGSTSVTIGSSSVASGPSSVAIGAQSVASGNYSVASGSYSVASGSSSVASGSQSVASGSYSVASGYQSVASGSYSVASGSQSVASGSYSVASGSQSVASHDQCTVLARNGETMSSHQTIVGKFNAKVAGLFIIGNGTSNAARSNAFVVDDSGNVTAKYFSGYANAIGGEGFKIYPENTNQINFGGTGSDTTVVFGAASKDSRPVPTTYKFGANGTATLLGSADMLDGYHEIKFFRHRGAANSTSISFPPTSSDLANITGIGSYTVQHSGHSSHLLNFNCEGGSTRYIQFLADYGNRLLFRCSTDSNLAQPWKTIAFTDSSITGNAATATKLKTPRTLWGNSFDGTASISGDMVFAEDKQLPAKSTGMRINPTIGFIGFSDVTETVSSRFDGISLGWGANPEKSATSVRINANTFTYKTYPILHSNNFSDYAPTKTGDGASGTWDISVSGNAATATTASKLGTSSVGLLNTPIYIKSGAATAVSAIKESLLTYGMDSNFSGSVSPIDMAVSAIHSANRIAFGKPNGVTVEYSTDGGENWHDYGATNEQKTRLISGLGQTFYIGGSNATTTVSTLFMLRITLNAVNLGTYTRPRKALINISTSGASNCQVKIESANVGSPTSFTTDATYPISGWSGWNSIPLGYKTTFGGGASQTSNNGVFRFTFSIGKLSSSSSNRLSVSDIAIYGETYWTTPSTLARTGHLYTYDETENVTFPAKVSAATFVGALSGNATTASKLGTSTVGSATQPIYLNGGTPTACTYTLGKSVPANAVFTDTTYSVATASTNGLMSSAMFDTKFVDSVGVKQGLTNTSIDGTVDVLSRSIYIRPHKNNVGGGYTDIAGNWDVAIPNATKDYDGSMSYADKSKLDGISLYAPKKVVALRLSFNADATVTVISAGGDYDMTQDAELMGSKYVEQTSTNNLYLTTFSLDTAAASTDTLNKLFRNSFVKFSFMGKSVSGISNYSITVKSNFDDDVLEIQFVSTKQNDSWVVDCVWEFF